MFERHILQIHTCHQHLAISWSPYQKQSRNVHFHPRDLHPRHNHYHKDMKRASWLNNQYDYLCKLVSGEQGLPRTLQVQKPGPLRTRLLPTPTATQNDHQHSIFVLN